MEKSPLEDSAALLTAAVALALAEVLAEAVLEVLARLVFPDRMLDTLIPVPLVQTAGIAVSANVMSAH